MSDPVAGAGATKRDWSLVHSSVIGAGHAIAGGVVSTTVTLVVHAFTLPLWSIAVKPIAVVPVGYVLVPAGPTTVADVQTSLAVALATFTGALWLPVHSAVVGAGHVIDGLVVSTTVSLVAQPATFPLWSLAWNEIVVVPSGYVFVPAGPVTVVGVQMSLEVALATLIWALPFPVHSAVWPAGQAIVGGVVSLTVTDDWQLFEFPHASLSENVMFVVPSAYEAAPDGPFTVVALH